MRIEIDSENKIVIIYRIINSKLRSISISYENISAEKLIERLNNAEKLDNSMFLQLSLL
jgi:hypothetical protein